MPTNEITRGMILDLSSNNDVYERGERMYHEGKIISYKQLEEPTGETIIRAQVEGNYKNYDVLLRLDQTGSLSHYSCSCESHSIWSGACKHVVAVFFARLEGQHGIFSAERMNQHARNLNDIIEKLVFENIDNELESPKTFGTGLRVYLTPTLFADSRDLRLTFSIGMGRMYIIKNLPSFVASVKNGDTVNYGRGLEFVHRREMFEPSSRKLLDFIIQEEDLYAEMTKRLSKETQYIQKGAAVSRSLTLSERNIDAFFNLYAGQSIDSDSDFGERIILTDGLPNFLIEITNEETGIKITAPSLNYLSVKGIKYVYFLTDGYLYRIKKGDGQIVSSLLKSFELAPKREVIFSSPEHLRFLSVVLPVIKRLNIINKITGIQKQQSEMKASMYFDTDSNDIIARIDFSYGDLIIDALSTNETKDILRDIAGEYTLKRKLLTLGFNEDKQKKRFRMTSDDTIYDFLSESINSLKNYGEIYISDALQKKAVRPKNSSINIRLSGNLLNIKLDNSEYTMSELLEAMESYHAKKKYHKLKDGRFLFLENENISATAELLDSLDISRKEIKGKNIVLPAYRSMYINELINNFNTTYVINKDEQFTILLNHFQNNMSLGKAVPKELVNILREYQKIGYHWLKTLSHYGFGGILADDMGLGKTLQIITLLLSERVNEKQSIVIAPTSLIYNWDNEIKRFAPKLKSIVISGFPELRRKLLKTPNIDVFITTYDIIKRDIDAYNNMEFEYIIADEAQNIKNPSTQAAKSLKQLKGKIRYALTGTPIENTLTDLWSIFDFIMPGYLHSSGKFQRIYEIPIAKYNDKQKSLQLRQQIAPFVLRRLKENVLTELPEKTETTLQADFELEQSKIYKAYLHETIGAFDDIIENNSLADNRMKILARLTRLRQLCCHPSLCLENYKGGSGKLELALETTQIAIDSGHRVLLFSQFTAMLDIIKTELKKTSRSYFYLDGATKPRERMEMTKQFNNGERDIFLISLKAGGTGLNLTGADIVIHYDPWWNPSVMNQASDRAYRFGQKNAVQVFNLVAKDSIEEKIIELQTKKLDLIDSVIKEGGSFINMLTEEELRRLFSE